MPMPGNHAVTPAAVLFDRDGTIIVDAPFNTDPTVVEPMPGAAVAIQRLRDAGVMTAVITNQSGVALGRMTLADVTTINARAEALLGPLGPVFVCVHAPDADCACRKPAPGLVEAAARALGVRTQECVVIGDIGSDIEAARRAGARAIMVPTAATLAGEIAAAQFVAETITEAVDAVLSGRV